MGVEPTVVDDDDDDDDPCRVFVLSMPVLLLNLQKTMAETD